MAKPDPFAATGKKWRILDIIEEMGKLVTEENGK
jgi:hypothetical protein